MESRTLRQENRRDFVRGSKGFSLSGYVWFPVDVKVSFYSNHGQGFNQTAQVADKGLVGKVVSEAMAVAGKNKSADCADDADK
jgi:hypothetical protein